MSPFEQQVADALQQHPSMPAAHWGPLAKELAPNVAAAIKAGTEAGISAYVAAWDNTTLLPLRPLVAGLEASEPAALRALRGGGDGAP